MRRSASMLLAAVALVVAGRPAAAHYTLGATLTGTQETPPVATTAVYAASFTLDPAGTLEYQIVPAQGRLSGPVVAAHLHEGGPGVVGPPLITLANTLTGSVPVDAAQIATLLAGGFYVNLHTAANPGGEVRGQVGLVVTADTCACGGAESPKRFKQCVRKAIARLEKSERRVDEVKALRRAVAKAACGATRVPAKSVACCLPRNPVENIVIERVCAAVSEARCGKLGGTSQGAGTSCASETPACGSPSGAFVD